MIKINRAFSKQIENTNEEFIDIKWINKDKEYLTKLVQNYNNKDDYIVDKLNAEVRELENVLSQLKKNCILTKKGVKIYSYDISTQIDIVGKGILNRKAVIEIFQENRDIQLFEYDYDYFTEGIKPGDYSIDEKINEEEREEYLGEVLEVFNSDIFPQYLVEDIEVYLSPYSFKITHGYMPWKKNEMGRRNIVLGSGMSFKYKNEKGDLINYKTLKPVIVHELGHIFENYYKDKGHSEFWSEYRKMHPDAIDSLNVSWKYRLNEHFAEDFKVYYMTHENHKQYFLNGFNDYGYKDENGLKNTISPYEKEKFTIFIEQYMTKFISDQYYRRLQCVK